MKACKEVQLIDGGIPENYYKQVKPEEKPEAKVQGKILIKFVKETCNMVVIVQHPGDDPYVEASHAGNGGFALMDESPGENVNLVETPIEGIVEDVTDNDSEGAGQLHPKKNKKVVTRRLMASTMLWSTINLETRHGFPFMKSWVRNPNRVGRKRLQWKLISTQGFWKFR